MPTRSARARSPATSRPTSRTSESAFLQAGFHATGNAMSSPVPSLPSSRHGAQPDPARRQFAAQGDTLAGQGDGFADQGDAFGRQGDAFGPVSPRTVSQVSTPCP